MKMSGDGSHGKIKTASSQESTIRVKLSLRRVEEKQTVRMDGSRKGSDRTRTSTDSLNVADEKQGNETPANMEEVIHGKSLHPKVWCKVSKTSILDSTEFNKNISSWFGEKGFTAMRSFFRASVLNSLQNEATSNNQRRCSDLEAVIVILITDYLLRGSQYFTMSVFTNEVLRPLSGSSTVLKNLLHRIGKSQGEMVEPVLSKEDVSFILRSLDLNPHSLLGAEILHRYFEASQNLLCIFMGLLKDNVGYISVRDRAVRDNDIVAAFSEGLNEEIGKFQYWFSDFNEQFMDVSIKLKKIVSMKNSQMGCPDKKNGSGGMEEEKALWERVLSIDDNLRRQQEALVKMRGKEREKLVIYAKELDALHREMNAKLKSIQSYERCLKQKERQMRGDVYLERNLILEKRGRGDYLSASENSENECDGVKYSTPNEKQSRRCWNVPNTREAGTQKFLKTENAIRVKSGGNLSDCSRVLDENLELKSVLREQHLRIDALTKRVSALSMGQPFDLELRHEQNNTVRNFEQVRKTDRVSKALFSDRGARLSVRPPGNFSSLQTAVRRAKIEVGSLKAEKDAIDMQYERLLNNKLSKKYSYSDVTLEIASSCDRCIMIVTAPFITVGR